MILYRLFILFYQLAIRLAAPFNAKARQWVAGRRDWRTRLRQGLQAVRPGDRPLLWMHCASLGEFEQGRPVLEAVRRQQPETAILLTFFSPSGYEVRKNYPLADHVAYLPADTPRNARDLLAIVRPDLVIFVKYEFWYYTLRRIQEEDIPLFLISALFRPGQIFDRPGGAPFRRLLQGFRHIFVQNEASGVQLERLGVRDYTIAGDTRVDRVYDLAQQVQAFPLVARFAGQSPVLVAGSTWPPDEDLLAGLLNGPFPANWKVIIAPHQIAENKLQRIEQLLSLPTLRYSRAAESRPEEARVLIIDNIGMLASLYQYGRLAYIGGGFGVAIHNTLEPVTFGLPVFFGPRHTKFEEAVQLVRRGGAFPVETTEELIAYFETLQNEAAWRAASAEARRYIEQNRGATETIVRAILPALAGKHGS